LVMGLVTGHGLFCLNAEDGEVDGQAVSLPPVLPLSLGGLSVIAMQDLVLLMKTRMAVTLLSSVLHSICAEHGELRKALQNSSTLRKRLGEARGDVTAGSTRAGSLLEASFQTFAFSPMVLPQFSPVSSSVVSDVSILVFDKDNYRYSLAFLLSKGLCRPGLSRRSQAQTGTETCTA
jgi:hypothetical protein